MEIANIILERRFAMDPYYASIEETNSVHANFVDEARFENCSVELSGEIHVSFSGGSESQYEKPGDQFK